MTGGFVDGETRAIKTVSVPTFDPHSDVAAVAFMQVFGTPSRSIDGSVHDLQQNWSMNSPAPSRTTGPASAAPSTPCPPSSGP
jgi:hypothetical protein